MMGNYRGSLIDADLSLRANIETYQGSTLMHLCLDERCLTSIFTKKYLQETYYRPLAVLQVSNPDAAIGSKFWNVFFDWIGDPDESHTLGVIFFNRMTQEQKKLIGAMAKLELTLAVKLNDPSFDDWQTRMVRQIRLDAQKWPEYELRHLEVWKNAVDSEAWGLIYREALN